MGSSSNPLTLDKRRSHPEARSADAHCLVAQILRLDVQKSSDIKNISQKPFTAVTAFERVQDALCPFAFAPSVPPTDAMQHCREKKENTQRHAVVRFDENAGVGLLQRHEIFGLRCALCGN
jgi:hypothetical protein